MVEDEHCVTVSRFAGDTLRHSVEEGLLSPAQLEDVLEQLRGALKRMHKAGVAHLDLSSKNVCVRASETRVRATIIDLGLARFKQERDFEEGKEFDLR